MNTMVKCMPDESSIETDMNTDKMHVGHQQYRDKYDHSDEKHVGHQQYGDRHEH